MKFVVGNLRKIAKSFQTLGFISERQNKNNRVLLLCAPVVC